MSQRQPQSPQQSGLDQPRSQMQQGWSREEQEPIKYGDVFNVTGDLAKEPIAPEDANMMQSAETRVFGQTQKGGAAASMQAAATVNERSGLVGHREATDAASERGVTVMEADVPGARIVTERVAGQVVGQYVEVTPVQGLAAGNVQNAITIGEALEASAQTAGDKAVDQSDAAAIQEAEVRATGSNVIVPGGIAATAQSAASYNAATNRAEEKIKLADVLSGATSKLAADKVVTRADAEGVVSAELRNNPNLNTHPGGVAVSMTTAARLNETINY